MNILHVDTNHPILLESLAKAGYHNIEGYDLSQEQVLENQHLYDGMVIRSRFTIDKDFIDNFPNLKFIARVGAGLENIDVAHAESKNIALFSAPEGNRNAVGEHSLGMLLAIFNKLNKADQEVRKGLWQREENRGVELDGHTVGIIGYGNMGKSFAKKLRGFDVEVLCYDIKGNVGDENARQVDFNEFCQKVDVISLHTPWTMLTHEMINKDFIARIEKPFWLINTARGKSVVTADLVEALKAKKILGAGLDVLEFEKSSFENLFSGNSGDTPSNAMPKALAELMQFDNVLFTPHVAGWTLESHERLATTIVDKILFTFGNR